MKKVFFISIWFFIITINSCEKSETTDPQPKLVRDFLTSNEFKENECLFAAYGKIGIGKVEKLNQHNDSALQLMIPIQMKETLVAYVQVIKLPKDNLPDNQIYFMNLIDLTSFDSNTLTGTAKMISLNYDFFQHSELIVENNKITSIKSFPLPEKFQNEFSKGKLKDFFACYRQIREWQETFDILYFVCDWAVVSCAAAATSYCIWVLGYYETK